MKAYRRTRWFLKCEKCKYTIVSEKTTAQREKRREQYKDRQIF